MILKRLVRIEIMNRYHIKKVLSNESGKYIYANSHDEAANKYKCITGVDLAPCTGYRVETHSISGKGYSGIVFTANYTSV